MPLGLDLVFTHQKIPYAKLKRMHERLSTHFSHRKADVDLIALYLKTSPDYWRETKESYFDQILKN